MFDKTVTVFNKYVNQKDEIYWYPTVISGCQFVDDKAANVAKTGLENADEANLHDKMDIYNQPDKTEIMDILDRLFSIVYPGFFRKSVI